jgi:hypothetical protein
MERLLVKLAHKDFMEHSARYLFSLITNKLVFCVPPSGLFCKTQLAFPIPYSILERSYYQTKMMQDPKVTQFELIESKMIRPSNCHIYIPKCILFHVSKKKLQECPLGTYKNETGSDKSLCYLCPSNELPQRAIFVGVRGIFFLPPTLFYMAYSLSMVFAE